MGKAASTSNTYQVRLKSTRHRIRPRSFASRIRTVKTAAEENRIVSCWMGLWKQCKRHTAGTAKIPFSASRVSWFRLIEALHVTTHVALRLSDPKWSVIFDLEVQRRSWDLFPRNCSTFSNRHYIRHCNTCSTIRHGLETA